MAQTKQQLKSNKVYLTGMEKAVIIEALKYWAQAFEEDLDKAAAEGRNSLFAQGWPTAQAESITDELWLPCRNPEKE